MITIFNRKAIYVGYSKEERNKVVKLLDANKIQYIEKEWYARGGQAEGGAGTFQLRGRGRFGQLEEYQTTYEIYVKVSDYEECEFLIRQMKEMGK